MLTERGCTGPVQVSFYLPLETSGVKEILLLVLLLASPSESQSWELEGCNMGPL